MTKSDETLTYTEAISFLISLARAEAGELALASKMYEAHKEIAPADVRRAARKRAEILEAIEVVQGAK